MTDHMPTIYCVYCKHTIKGDGYPGYPITGLHDSFVAQLRQGCCNDCVGALRLDLQTTELNPEQGEQNGRHSNTGNQCEE